MKSSKTFIEKFQAARMAGTPIIAVETTDNFAAERVIIEGLATATPCVRWDCVQGWTPSNKAGLEAIGKAGVSPQDIVNPVECLAQAKRLPGLSAKQNGESGRAPGSILFVHSAHEYLTGYPEFTQALLNLRDEFKSNGRCVVLLGPAFNLPGQLKDHVWLIDQPLPSRTELAKVVASTTDNKITGEAADAAVSAVLGLSQFSAEQAVAMSFSQKRGELDSAELWERKKAMIRQTPGLSVWESERGFEGIGGCEAIKDFSSAILHNYEAIVFCDEMEKMLAGGGAGDTSGVTQSMLGSLLSEMENKRYSGMVLVGVPGAGKSEIAKAMGKQASAPVINFNLGDLKNSLVGQSEAQLRAALKVIDSVSNGKALFVATSNNLASLPTELLERFTLGTWFFDLPTQAERTKIWEIQLNAYGLPAQEITFDDGWVGRQIRNCCEIGKLSNLPLAEAAKFIVPMTLSAGDRIKALRMQANGKYLSAAYAGAYVYTEAQFAFGETRRAQFDE